MVLYTKGRRGTKYRTTLVPPKRGTEQGVVHPAREAGLYADWRNPSMGLHSSPPRRIKAGEQEKGTGMEHEDWEEER